MAALNSPGGILEVLEFSRFRDFWDFSLEEASAGEFFTTIQEHNIPG
jgi:hypothetical protein